MTVTWQKIHKLGWYLGLSICTQSKNQLVYDFGPPDSAMVFYKVWVNSYVISCYKPQLNQDEKEAEKNLDLRFDISSYSELIIDSQKEKQLCSHSKATSFQKQNEDNEFLTRKR